MDASLLYRKRTPLAGEGLPWLMGDDQGSWCARRNTTGEAGVSAIMIRAVQAALQHVIVDVRRLQVDGRSALVVNATSKTNGRLTQSCLIAGNGVKPWLAYIPNGGLGHVTYYLGLLVLGEALSRPADYADLLDAYEALLRLTDGGPLLAAHKDVLCRVADEMNFALQYEGLPAISINDRLAGLQVADAVNFQLDLGGSDGLPAFTPQVFYDVNALQAYRNPSISPAPVASEPSSRKRRSKRATKPEAGPVPIPTLAPLLPAVTAEAPKLPDKISPMRFVGQQVQLVFDGLRRGKTLLLAGPTGTGKTLAVEDVVQQLPHTRLVRIEGKEGMLDVDFLGNIVPRGEQRVWQDGPLAEAIQIAQSQYAILFLDELTRFPREQINLLIGFLNQKSGDICRQEGITVDGPGPFYVARVPQDNSKVFICPCAGLLIVAAANFGKDYAVYPLDPALRRRFTMVVEFDYPAANAEIDLLTDRVGLDRSVAEVLVAVSIESRRVHENGDMPGQIDTASLLEWGRKCVEFEARTVDQVMDMAALTWADLVCGRTSDGRVDKGHFQALSDHLDALGKLPKGGTS